MEANFDLLLAGCNTRCKHCYVQGGPGRCMALEDALLCLRKLDELAEALPFPASLTLDNEPMNHPDLVPILRAVGALRHIKPFHHGMTTGIALLGRRDRDDVIRAYLDRGWRDFGVTLHGSPEHHDELVRRPGAFQASLEAAAYLKAQGAKVNVSLMFNRFFREDAALLDRVLARLAPEYVYFAIPNYTPHAQMPAYEPYRGRLGDLIALAPCLEAWGQDVPALLEAAMEGTPGEVIRQIEAGDGLRQRFSQPQEELYLAVHPDGLLYLGNTGAETACLGDLRILDPVETAALLRAQPGNRDYGAFYEAEVLPTDRALIRALGALPPDLLYSDPASVICRGLEALNVPTKLLSRRPPP